MPNYVNYDFQFSQMRCLRNSRENKEKEFKREKFSTLIFQPLSFLTGKFLLNLFF